jgi:hypothetical protein
MANKKIKNLIEKHIKAENELREELEKLPRHGSFCNCEEPQPYSFVESDSICIDEFIAKICLNCGGYEQ